ncbi:MAG: hypothetical protein WBH03_23405, partial [Cyclobacteriaceae bacterium]
SVAKADLLARYAGFESFGAYSGRYSLYCNMMSGSLQKSSVTILISSQLYQDYMKRLNPIFAVLDNSVPHIHSFEPTDQAWPGVEKAESAGIIIAIAEDLITGTDSTGKIPSNWFVFPDGDAASGLNELPPDRIIKNDHDLQLLILLLCSPHLVALSNSEIPSAEKVNTLSDTINGTVFQGNVSIQQDNNSTGQQFVTSSDVHITNNNHYNQKS